MLSSPTMMRLGVFVMGEKPYKLVEAACFMEVPLERMLLSKRTAQAGKLVFISEFALREQACDCAVRCDWQESRCLHGSDPL